MQPNIALLTDAFSALRCACGAAERERQSSTGRGALNDAAELAGFFTAHAVWSVSDGEILVPIYGLYHEKNGREMERLALERLEDAVAEGKKRLDENPKKADRAVLIFDGRITLNGRKVDSLIVEFREFSAPETAMVVAIPYTPASNQRQFAVHRPKVLQLPPDLEPKVPEIFEAFFRGAEAHEKGAKIWNERLDESV